VSLRNRFLGARSPGVLFGFFIFEMPCKTSMDTFLFLFCFVLFCFFPEAVSLRSPGSPGILFVDQAGLKLRDPFVSRSRVLG
ncbi:mCG1031343, partial [Mus musculus]